MIENGINALELVGTSPISPADLTKAVALLQANYGTEYSPEKVSLLFDMIQEAGWTSERFLMTLKWMLKNRPYPNWTISDWFSYGIKLYPEAWYLQKCQPHFDVRKEMDRYKIGDGVIGYKWKDGVELPLEKLADVF